jgi:hypothetical protein
MILLVISIIAFIVAGIVLYPKPKKKQAKPKKIKFQIPASFWDDYNYCLQSIHKMKPTDCSRVENLIDNIMYQYVELLDTNTYIDKLSNLVDAYNKKVKTFLITKHLN